MARGTHVMVVDKSRLIEKIGTLSQERINEILDSIIWMLGDTRNGNIGR